MNLDEARTAFARLRAAESGVSPAELDEVWAALETVAAEEILGEWKGDDFATGHRLHEKLFASRWYGKTFNSVEDAKPLICRDEDGNLYSDVKSGNGEASLWNIEFRGEVTATMVYDGAPIFDHFKESRRFDAHGHHERKIGVGSRRRTALLLPARASVIRAEQNSTSAMQMTAALSHGPHSPFTLDTVEIERTPRRRDPGSHRRDRPVPHRSVHEVGATGTTRPLRVRARRGGGGRGRRLGDRQGRARRSRVVELSQLRCVQAMSQRSSGVLRKLTRAQQLWRTHRRLDADPARRNPLRSAFFGQSSFAEYVIASADNTVVVDPAVDLTVAAPLGCGFQTGAGAVLNLLRPEPDSTFAVFGAGSVGLAALLAARAAGVSTLVAVDPVAQRRELAEEFGAVTVDPTTEDAVEAHRTATDGGSTHSLDTTGIGSVINQAVTSLRARGTLAVVGLGASTVEMNMADIMLSGKTIRGCIEGESEVSTFIPELVELFTGGRFPIDRLVTRYAFSDINKAVERSSVGARHQTRSRVVRGEMSHSSTRRNSP